MRTLLPYVGRYAPQIALSLLFGSIWVASQLAIPSLMQDLIDSGIMRNDTGVILQRGGLMIAAAVVNLLSVLANIYVLTRITAGVSRDLRDAIFETVIDWSPQARQQYSTSTLVTRAVNDVKQVSNFVDLALRKIYTVSITIIGAVVMSFILDVRLALLLLVIAPFLLIVTTRLTATASPRYVRVRAAVDSINRLFRQNMRGIRVVKAFGRTEYEQARFAEAADEAYEATVGAERSMQLLAPLVTLFVNVLVLVILWRGAVRAEVGDIAIGVLVALIEYVVIVMANIQAFATIITILPRSRIALERIGEVLRTSDTLVLPDVSRITDSVPASGIVVNDVSFRYPGAAYPAVDEVTLHIQPGSTTAIIGSTGSGKSTLLHLLVRDYDANHGSIVIEGHDITSLSAEDFNRLFTVVPQQTFLFSGSVRANIQSGKPDATDDEIWDVLDDCQIGDFFRRSPAGLDTNIAQSAVNLSGGQKQRISLARGLIRDTRYYLFDDCFSALDYSTERQVRHAIRRRLAGRTIVVVAQRVATVRRAAEIVVMEMGRVSDRGTHEELVSRSTIYQEIIASQLQVEATG